MKHITLAVLYPLSVSDLRYLSNWSNDIFENNVHWRGGGSTTNLFPLITFSLYFVVMGFSKEDDNDVCHRFLRDV